MIAGRSYLALILLSFCSPYMGAGEAFSTVIQIEAWTTTGDRIDLPWVSLTSANGDSVYHGRGKLIEILVPTGDYTLQVSAPGFLARRQVLSAYQPKVFRSIALPIAPPDPAMASSSLSGKVTNYDGQLHALRIRLTGLYGNELRESRVDSQGSFSFPADEGAYLLSIVADLDKGVRLIDSKPVRVEGDEIISIDLKGKLGVAIPLAQRR